MNLQEIEWGDMDWIKMARDRDTLRALVNAVINRGFHKMRGISGLAEFLLGFQEGLCCMELVS
jgi:hypothetical protein